MKGKYTLVISLGGIYIDVTDGKSDQDARDYAIGRARDILKSLVKEIEEGVPFERIVPEEENINRFTYYAPDKTNYVGIRIEKV